MLEFYDLQIPINGKICNNYMCVTKEEKNEVVQTSIDVLSEALSIPKSIFKLVPLKIDKENVDLMISETNRNKQITKLRIDLIKRDIDINKKFLKGDINHMYLYSVDLTIIESGCELVRHDAEILFEEEKSEKEIREYYKNIYKKTKVVAYVNSAKLLEKIDSLDEGIDELNISDIEEDLFYRLFFNEAKEELEELKENLNKSNQLIKDLFKLKNKVHSEDFNEE